MNINDMTALRGFMGQLDDGVTPSSSWTASLWKNGQVFGGDHNYPQTSSDRAWFDDDVYPLTHNCILDTTGNVTLSSMLFNGSYTISKDPAHMSDAIVLQSALAADSQIQVLSGASSVAPDIQITAGDPVVTLTAGSRLTLSGVVSGGANAALTITSPAGTTITSGTGGGTLALTGADTFTGPVSVLNGTVLETAYLSPGGTTVNNATLLWGGADHTADQTIVPTGPVAYIGTTGSALTIPASLLNTASTQNLATAGVGNVIITNDTPNATYSLGSQVFPNGGTLTLQATAPTTYTTNNICPGDPADGVLGNVGTAALHSNVTLAINSWFGVGRNTGGSGMFTMDGNSALTDAGWFNVGCFGGAAGTLSLTDNATLTQNGGGSQELGCYGGGCYGY